MSPSQDERNEILHESGQKEYYRIFLSKKKNIACLGFCAGFILSTILAFTAYVFSQGYWMLQDIIDEHPNQEIGSNIEIQNGHCQRRMIVYHDLLADRKVTESQLFNVTHLILLPIEVESSGALKFRNGQEEMRFKKIVEKFSKTQHLKKMFSLTEVSEKGQAKFKNAIRNPESRKILLNLVIAFIIEHHLDGVDVNWTRIGSGTDLEILTSFCVDLRDKLNNLAVQTKRKNPFVISVVLPAKKTQWDFDGILKHIDFLTIMTNAYYGSFLSEFIQFTGPLSPLYSKQSESPEKNVDYSMKRYSCATKQPTKLNIMVEFQGKYWENVIKPKNPTETLWLTAEPINGSIRKAGLQWKDLAKNGWNVSAAAWNNDARTPYIWKPDERKYLAFENPRSLKEKINYAIDKNIGGLAVWRIDSDDDENTMLKTLSSGDWCVADNNSNAVNFNCT